MKTLKQSELFPKKIDRTFRDEKHVKTFHGGRASLKSGSIARYIVLILFASWAKGISANAIVVRKLKETLRKSVFSEVVQAIYALGLESYFVVKYSPLAVYCGSNSITFHGANGSDKNLKGVTEKDIRFLWFEEADQLDNLRHMNDIIATFARNFTSDYDVFIAFNPPDDEYHWIFNTIKNEKYVSQELTYLDDDKGFLPKELLEIIEDLKETDFELYKEIYLGKPRGRKKKYFKNCIVHDRENSPKDYVFAGIDASTTGDDQTRMSIIRYSDKDGVMYHEKFITLDTSNWEDGKTIFENIQEIDETLREERVSFVIIDRGGGGQGIIDELTRNKTPYQVMGVYFGSKPHTEGKTIIFNNLRSQIFYKLSDYMSKGTVQMRFEDKALVMKELVFFDFKKVGKEEYATKFALISKDDIKALLGHSPDYSDALALSVEACRYAIFN
ncbi:phage terminase large subunit [Enterococcus larvae]|uniref:phage terminase large subunit n=1 Tax=Enterococcus larvae TaxID=2794352 RepID=UPI003F3B6B64